MSLTVSQISTIIAVGAFIGLLLFLVFARRVFFAGLRGDMKAGKRPRVDTRHTTRDQIDALVTRAHAHVDLGNEDDARRDFESALAYLQPGDPEAEVIRAELDRLHRLNRKSGSPSGKRTIQRKRN